MINPLGINVLGLILGITDATEDQDRRHGIIGLMEAMLGDVEPPLPRRGEDHSSGLTFLQGGCFLRGQRAGVVAVAGEGEEAGKGCGRAA